MSETRIAEKEKEQQKVKENEVKQEVKEVKEEVKEVKPEKEPTAAIVKKDKVEGKSPRRHAQNKGPAPKIPDLPPKQGDRVKQPPETTVTKQPAPPPPEPEKQKPEVIEDKIEADLKKVAEKLEQEEPKLKTKVESSPASTTSSSTKDKGQKLKDDENVKRDFPQELTDTDSDGNDSEQPYDVPPAPIVAAPRVPNEKQTTGKDDIVCTYYNLFL